MQLKRFVNILFCLGVLAPLSVLGQSIAERKGNLPARRDPANKGHDLALERIEANRMWFGGEASPEYLDFKGVLSKREIERWGLINPKEARPLAKAGSIPLAAAGTSTWVNLGPNANLINSDFPDIDGGRLNAIITHPSDPNLVYIASSTGGVFKCTNADPTSASQWIWTPLTDSLPNTSTSGNVPVGAMAMSPASPSTLYIGLGDFTDDQGRGFYRSTNGGDTWTQSTGTRNATRTTCILPLSASIVLWGTNDGLKRSTDGGATFTPVSIGGSTTDWAWSATAFSPTDVVIVRTALRSGYRWSFLDGGIWWSSDAGATWSKATVSGLDSFGRVSLAPAPGTSIGWGLAEGTQTIATMAKGLLKTDDKGHTWTFIAAPTISGGLFQGTGNQMDGDGTQAGYNQALAVNPLDPNQVFVGAKLALYRTDDGGLNWTQLTHWYGHQHVYAHADFHCTAWSKTGTPVLFVGSDGGLAVLPNPSIPVVSIPKGSGYVASVVTFVDNRRNRGLATHQAYHLGSTIATSPANSKDRITLGLQDNGTRVRQDMGTGLENSSTFEDQIGGDGFGTLIHPMDGNLMLGSYYNVQVQKSTNGGTSPFAPATTGITEAGNSGRAPFSTRIAQGEADVSGNTVYTFVNTAVYKSVNFGDSWTRMGTTGLDETFVIRQVNAAKSDPRVVAVVTTGGTGFITINSGTTWTQFGTIPNATAMSYVWFDTSNAQILYVTSAVLSSDNNHLWKSVDGGTTWTALDRNPGFPAGIPVHAIKNAPSTPSTLFVGTDFGVYQSLDGGATWTRYGLGLPLVSVRDLYLAPDGSFARVATYGRGVWELSFAAAPVAPTIATQPTNVSAVVGQTATFSVVAAGTAPFTYQWKKNDVAIALNGTGSSYTTPALVLGDSGSTYKVTVTNSVGSLDSSAATLTVTAPAPAPGISAHPQNFTTGLVGGEATFSVTATGTGPFTYAWTKNGSAVGTNSATLTLTGLVIGDSGQKIRVTVSNSGGSTLSNEATLTVRTRDLSGDATVDVLDLAYFSRVYGTNDAAADLNGDGTVNDADLDLLLAGL